MRVEVQDTIAAIENLFYLNIGNMRLTRTEVEALVSTLELGIQAVELRADSDTDTGSETGDSSEEVD